MKNFFFEIFRSIRNSISSLLACINKPNTHDLIDKLNRLNQLNLSTALMHQKTFPQFKNIYNGRDVAVIACGPTMNDYIPIPNAIHIGVNSAFRQDRFPLDVLFTFDIHSRTREYLDTMNHYRDAQCVKFYGIVNELSADCNWIPSESDCIKANAFRFRADSVVWAGPCNNLFPYDISTMPLADYGSIIFSAIQFALWTNPKRIFLVGCDCTNNGHFDKSPSDLSLKDIHSGYIALKKFASSYYPLTEIISVNPIGLKGLFKDWNQKDNSPMPN